MSTERTKRVYTLDELKDKAELALDVPRLVEIVKTAPLAKDGGVNLTWVRNQAYQYVLEETGDVKDAKKLADSTRFLAMLRRENAGEFEKLEKQPEESKKVTFDRVVRCDVTFKELVEFQLEQVKENQGIESGKILPISYILREKIIEELEKILGLNFDPEKMAKSWNKNVLDIYQINRTDDPTGFVHTYLPACNGPYIHVYIHPWQRRLVVDSVGSDGKGVSTFEMRNLRRIAYEDGYIDFSSGEAVYPTQRIQIAANGDIRTIL